MVLRTCTLKRKVLTQARFHRTMLVDAGVKYVVLGHSERREYFAETNETVNKKVLKAFEHGITPIMCCGETLDAERAGSYNGLHPSAG